MERDLLGLEATEDLLHCWEPLRRGVEPPGFPVNALVDFTPEGRCSFRFQSVADGNDVYFA